MATTFNDMASPKIKTEKFKIYINMGSESTPQWELQGRGIESWTVDENNDVTKVPDVLGFVDVERGVSQPTQTGVQVKLRKGSKLAEELFNAWYTKDYSALDALSLLHKFEFVDGQTQNTCKARREDDVLITVNSFTGEAGGNLGFDIDIHYANKITLGSMPKVDGATITFTPDSAA